MSDVYELDSYLDGIQCKHAGTAHVETGGLDHKDTELPMQIEVDRSSGEVWLSVRHTMPGETTAASATCYLTPEQATDLAEAIRTDTADAQSHLFSDHANVWVDMGWLRVEGVASSETTKGEVEYLNGSLSVVTTVEGDSGGEVLGAVQLAEGEREWLATTLIRNAATAREHEAGENKVEQSESGRLERFFTPTTVRRVAGAGIGLAVAGVVFTRVMQQVASVDPQQIDSVGAPLPLPSVAVVGLAVGFAVVMVIGMNGGDIIGGGGR